MSILRNKLLLAPDLSPTIYSPAKEDISKAALTRNYFYIYGHWALKNNSISFGHLFWLSSGKLKNTPLGYGGFFYHVLPSQYLVGETQPRYGFLLTLFSFLGITGWRILGVA